MFCFNCVLCESETNSHLVNDRFYCTSKWVTIFKNTNLVGLYQTQFIIKRLEQFVWVEKTVQNKALKIIEQNITAKYSDIWNHLSWVMIQRLRYLPRRSKKANNPQIRIIFFKARLQLQKWIELSRTNILKQIYYEVRYGSVEVLQWISAYSNLFQVNCFEVWDQQITNCLLQAFVIWPFLRCPMATEKIHSIKQKLTTWSDMRQHIWQFRRQTVSKNASIQLIHNKYIFKHLTLSIF